MWSCLYREQSFVVHVVTSRRARWSVWSCLRHEQSLLVLVWGRDQSPMVCVVKSRE